MSGIRNVAIIAHVDHGKTTLVDKIIHQCNVVDERKESGRGRGRRHGRDQALYHPRVGRNADREYRTAVEARYGLRRRLIRIGRTRAGSGCKVFSFAADKPA